MNVCMNAAEIEARAKVRADLEKAMAEFRGTVQVLPYGPERFELEPLPEPISTDAHRASGKRHLTKVRRHA